MNSLPNELLIEIALHLDCSAPSVTRFAHEPRTEPTSSDSTPLKFLSLVSWRWRKIVLPILFHYSRMPLDTNPQWVPIDARLVDSMQGQMATLSSHEFQIFQKMRSKFKSSSTFAYEQKFDDLLINLYQIQDGDNFLKSVPHILWLPHLPKSFVQFGQFVAQYGLKHHIKSIVVYTSKEYELRHVSTADAPLARAVSGIWSQIFDHLEPSRVVVAAPPTTLACLLDTQMLSTDAWAFDMKMHYIELLQSDPPRLEHTETTPCRPWNQTLIHRRPWCHLSYNEGSSITAYSTYEYHLKQSPKMLYLILVRLVQEKQNCCNITSIALTGVFPFATNVASIIRILHKLPTIHHVSIQLAPGPENKLLSNPKRMGRAQPADFWLEWRENYKIVASYLGAVDFADGAVFESRDCALPGLADDVDECMDVLRVRGTAWRKTRSGCWERDRALDERVDDVTEHVQMVV